MESPNLPKLSVNNKQISQQSSEKQESTKSKKPSLKRVLSKEIKTSEQEVLFADDQNHFIVEENNERRLIMKSIVTNENLEEPLLNVKATRKLRFSQTEIHEVENWKEYNRPSYFCCWCFH